MQNAESLGLTQKILEINPEFYTLWNYRREIIQSMMTAGHLTAGQIGESEKSLTQLALEKNPKSYCAWHHRRWVAELGCVDLGEELATCTKFLNLDARNCTLSICQLCTPTSRAPWFTHKNSPSRFYFYHSVHCWDYRRFIAKRANVATADEFAYTSTKIEQNFSNFSAWHYRSRLMPVVFHEKAELLTKIEDGTVHYFHSRRHALDSADAKHSPSLCLAPSVRRFQTHSAGILH